MKNKKGFTLVELLLTILILGIISGLSIPLIRDIKSKNEIKKYNSYGDSLINAAKLYRLSYEIDLFGNKDSGCALITYNQLKEKELIKSFPDSKISCNDSKTRVRIVKLNNKYGYSYKLYCGIKDSSGIAKNAKLKASSYSKTVSKFTDNDETYIDENNDGFNDNACNINNTILITGEPEKNLEAGESYDVNIKVTSATGIYPGSSISYTWIDADDKNGNTTIDFDTNQELQWNKLTLKAGSINSQKEKILANPSVPIEITQKITTPAAAPAFYLLVIKADNIKDLTGKKWQVKNTESKYIKLGIYNIGQKYTLTYNNNGGSGCDKTSLFQEKNGNKKWGQLCTPKKTGYTFTGWTTSSGVKIDGNTVATSDLTLYAQWRVNVCTITFNPNKGVFNNNANNVTKKIDYGSSVDNFWNAKGGTYDATRTHSTYGFHINTDVAWIRTGDNQTFNQENSYTAIQVCPNLANGDQSVTLKVNWKYDDGTAAAYAWKFKEKDCDGSDYKRVYHYIQVRCYCDLNEDTGQVIRVTNYEDITLGTDDKAFHTGHLATIHYKHNDNGKNACDHAKVGNSRVKVNTYIKQICAQDPDDLDNSFHGYVWYSGSGANGKWHNFIANDGDYHWYHASRCYDNRYSGTGTGDAYKQNACSFSCQMKFNYVGYSTPEECSSINITP